MSEAEGVRCLRPNRQQTEWRMMHLDGMLPQDRRARVVWQFVESMDLIPFYERIGSRRHGAGRPAADPAVLLALWLFATLEGVGSARHLAQLCERDAAFQ